MTGLYLYTAFHFSSLVTTLMVIRSRKRGSQGLPSLPEGQINAYASSRLMLGPRSFHFLGLLSISCSSQSQLASLTRD